MKKLIDNLKNKEIKNIIEEIKNCKTVNYINNIQDYRNLLDNKNDELESFWINESDINEEKGLLDICHMLYYIFNKNIRRFDLKDIIVEYKKIIHCINLLITVFKEKKINYIEDAQIQIEGLRNRYDTLIYQKQISDYKLSFITAIIGSILGIILSAFGLFYTCKYGEKTIINNTNLPTTPDNAKYCCPKDTSEVFLHKLYCPLDIWNWDCYKQCNPDN